MNPRPTLFRLSMAVSLLSLAVSAAALLKRCSARNDRQSAAGPIDAADHISRMVIAAVRADLSRAVGRVEP